MNKRVVIGLSGGVDSSVAAHLLLEQGYEVIGMFMRNWHDESVTINQECPWIDDSNDALLVAERLGIPFQVIDLSAEYKERIVDYMFREYAVGRTPNPDVLCNREIKFDLFLKAARDLGADFVATGHYVQKSTTTDSGRDVHHLLAGADGNKDQSYFLCQLTQDQLAHALFPIGHLQKSEVRNLARSLDLITAEKRDSQGLCFIGKVSLPTFLQQQLARKEGEVIEVPPKAPLFQPVGADWAAVSAPTVLKPEMGHPVGKHPGAHYFTVGQRKGLRIGGKEEPLFVLATDTVNNILYVGQGEDHPGLYRKALFVQQREVHWVNPVETLQPGESARYQVRIRYRQALQEAELHQTDHGLYVVFDQPQKAITPGQFVAWYHANELVGSGVIHQ
jgi:tRNA-specific 2-thiouridylase